MAIVLIIGALTSNRAQGGPPTRFYVSLQGNDAWSGKRVRPDAQGSDGPFATLKRAQQAVRAYRQQDLKQPVEVVVMAGTYYLKEPLVFTPADSGTWVCPITYRAATGAKVILSGGRPVNGWRKEAENLWAVDWPGDNTDNRDFRLMRVGAKWAIRARHPNYDPQNPYTGGWLFAQAEGRKTDISGPDQQGSTQGISFAEGVLPEWKNARGAEAHIFIAWGWVNAIVPVEKIDYARQSILFPEEGAAQDVRAGNRFFIENVREALDAPGEWYLDTERNKVLYLPDSPDFPETTAVAAALDRLIVCESESGTDRHTEHLRFKGFIFMDTDYSLTRNYYSPAEAAIRMSGARHCAIEACEFRWLGGYALRLDSSSEHISFVGNRVHHVGQGGVILLGDSASQPHHNVIAGNTMEHLGLIYKHVAGVYVTTGSDNLVLHNTIADVPRYGVSLKSYGPGNSSHRNLVEYNDIRRCNLETNDTGAIETLGRDQQNSGNIIRYNLILDSVGMITTPEGKILTPHFTWGIYLDDYSSGTIIYGNIVSRNVVGGVCVHGGKDNLIENNIFAESVEQQVRLQPRDDFMKGNRFVRNILVYSRPESSLIFSWDSRRDRFIQWDYNLYWLKGKDLKGLDVKNTPEGTFAQWLNAGYDTHSRVANPMFKNAAQDDYRLNPSSPAWPLGFKPIPIEKIGAAYWRTQF